MGPEKEKFLKKGEFTRNTLFSVIGFGVMMVANFAFNAVVGRMFGTAEYGIFTTFLYFLLGFSQTFNSLQLGVTKYTIRHRLDKRAAVREFTPTFFLFSLVILAAFVAASFFARGFFKLRDPIDFMVGGAVVAAWLLQAGYRGIIQGHMDFFGYGLNIGLEGLLRTAAGTFLLVLGLKVTGAIGVSVISVTIALAVLFFGNIGYHLKNLARFKFRLNRDITIEFLKALLILLPFGIAMNMDLFMVNNIIGAPQSSYVGVCAQIGKNLVVLAMVVANVVFSYTVKKDDKPFGVGMALTAGVFLLSAITVLLIGRWMVTLIWGVEFAPAASILPVYVLYCLPIGILQNIVNYAVAKDSNSAKVALWAFLPFIISGYYFLLKFASLQIFFAAGIAVFTIFDGILLFLLLKFQKKTE